MEIKKSTEFKVKVRMVNSTTGDGDTGLTYSDVTVYLQKQAGSSAVKTLASGAEWVEVDATNFPGVYDLLFTTSDTDTAGFLAYSVAATDDDTYLGLLEVVEYFESDTISRIGSPTNIDSGGATLSANLAKIAGTGFIESSDALSNLSAAVQAGLPNNNTATANTETTGSLISGTYASTYLSNGTYWITAPVTPAVGGYGLNVYLDFSVSAGEAISTVTIRGYWAGAPRYADVVVYNWATASWDQLSDSTSRIVNASSNSTYTFALLAAHLKDDGTVRIGFRSTSTTTGDRLNIDQVIVTSIAAGATASDIADAVYDRMANTVYDGAIWIDTVNGVAGTDLGVNGLQTYPVDNLADALTLATALGVKHLHLMNGSSITFTSSMAHWNIEGHGGTIDLGGQDITGIQVNNCTLTGTSTGYGGTFEDCSIETATMGGGEYHNCQLSGTFTTITGNYYWFLQGTGGDPSLADPTIAWTANTSIALRNFSGQVTLSAMDATNTLLFAGRGECTIASNCTGGSIVLRGFVGLVDQVGGGFAGTIDEDERFSRPDLVADVAAGVPTAAQVKTAVFEGLIADHSGVAGSAAEKWESMISGTVGIRQVTLHLQTSGGVTIPNAMIAVYDASNTGHVTSGSMDSNGDFYTNLDDGDYSARILLAGYAFTSPTPFTVSGDGTINLEGTPHVVAHPGDPNLCRIYGFILDPNGDPVENAVVIAHTPDGTTTIIATGGNTVSGRAASVVTDATGYFELDLIRLVEVTLEIPVSGVEVTKTVPDADTQDLSTW